MMLLEYFTKGVRSYEVASRVGLEIETDFLLNDRSPISVEVTRKLLAAKPPGPWQTRLELGRQKIELAIYPHQSFDSLYSTAGEALSWLYRLADSHNALPFFGPEIDWPDDLLWVQEERDEVWVQLDGRLALEELCRCSSVQFTIDVPPSEAIEVVNRLWVNQIHDRDYQDNERRWRAYITHSRANYRADRYGGPGVFEDLTDYINQLVVHPVAMHQGQTCWSSIGQLKNVDIDLFLRSVWWHYRLRRYNDTLTVEIRPFSRRLDIDLITKWQLVKQALKL